MRRPSRLILRLLFLGSLVAVLAASTVVTSAASAPVGTESCDDIGCGGASCNSPAVKIGPCVLECIESGDAIGCAPASLPN